MVNSYFWHKYKSGIISLTFNTDEKWVPYARTSMTTYEFYPNDKDVVMFTVEIPEKFKEVDNGWMAVFDKQEKDQITYIWIPFSMLMDIDNS